MNSYQFSYHLVITFPASRLQFCYVVAFPPSITLLWFKYVLWLLISECFVRKLIQKYNSSMCLLGYIFSENSFQIILENIFSTSYKITFLLYKRWPNRNCSFIFRGIFDQTHNAQYMAYSLHAFPFYLKRYTDEQSILIVQTNYKNGENFT